MTLPKLDLEFPEIYSLKLLGIMDTSSYPPNYNYQNPTVEITPPGFPKVVLPFEVGSLNLFNSSNLAITCADIDGCGITNLPDGIWNVKYSLTPVNTNFIEKSFIRVKLLQQKFEQVFLETDMALDADIKLQDMDKIDQVEVFINGAIAAANRGNNILAMKLYNIASRLIDVHLKTK